MIKLLIIFCFIGLLFYLKLDFFKDQLRTVVIIDSFILALYFDKIIGK